MLEIDQRTVAESAQTGVLSRRARNALERSLQEGVGSAAALQRERNDRLEERVTEVESQVEALGKEARRRLAAVEGEVGALRRDDPQGTGAGHAGAGSSRQGSGEAEAGASGQGRKPPTRPSVRREYPDLATREPADDNEEIFGDAFPLIVEWRELKDAHPNEGRGLDWLCTQERLLEIKLALLEEHGMTLPPEKQPLRGLDRSGQISWRRTALYDTRRARARRELARRIGRALTLGLWWR